MPYLNGATGRFRHARIRVIMLDIVAVEQYFVGMWRGQQVDLGLACVTHAAMIKAFAALFGGPSALEFPHAQRVHVL